MVFQIKNSNKNVKLVLLFLLLLNNKKLFKKQFFGMYQKAVFDMYQAPRLSAPKTLSKKYFRGLKITTTSYLTKLQSDFFIFLLKH